MAKSKTSSPQVDGTPGPAQRGDGEGRPTLRERRELILFLVVEVLCLLLFIDFLFIGFYVK